MRMQAVWRQSLRYAATSAFRTPNCRIAPCVATTSAISSSSPTSITARRRWSIASCKQSGQFRESELDHECILDSNDLERERGITILAKNIALPYKGVKINIIDTPGHADFGGEVERVVRMADGAVVLVDAAEGPMPQTRFVLSKALEAGLRPIVVINKIDRPDAQPHATLDEAFGLFMELDADEHLEDFKYLFASGREGYATTDPAVRTDSMQPLLDMVLESIPGPEVDPDAPLQMLVTTLDWSEFVGRIAIGRITVGQRSRTARRSP